MPNKADNKKSKTRGLKVVAVAAGLVLIGSGVAIAFWTQGGAGTGTATTGTTSTNLVITSTTPTVQVAPGVDVPLSGSVTNPNDATVRVTAVSATIGTVTPLSGQTCAATNYSITGTAPVGLDVAKNASVPWTGLALHFNTSATVDQNGCKGATVNITYSSN